MKTIKHAYLLTVMLVLAIVSLMLLSSCEMVFADYQLQFEIVDVSESVGDTVVVCRLYNIGRQDLKNAQIQVLDQVLILKKWSPPVNIAKGAYTTVYLRFYGVTGRTADDYRIIASAWDAND